MKIVKWIVRWLLTQLYQVEIEGAAHYKAAGKRVLIVANHASFLDGILLYAFLADRLTFVVNTRVADAWWVRFGLAFVDFVTMESANPLSVKHLVSYLREDHKAVIFPEGRITVTGALMKIYQGPGLVADRSRAMVLPVRIDGAQYTPFSRLKGRVTLHWFPRIRISFLAPRYLSLPDNLCGRDRRDKAGRQLAQIMTEMMFATSHYYRRLFDVLLDARQIHGGAQVVLEDIERKPLDYNQLLTRVFVMSDLLAEDTCAGERVGLLLPNMCSTVVTFFSLQVLGRVPAILNYTAGVHGMLTACTTAQIRIVYTSRRFITAAQLEGIVAQLEDHVKVVYLEDLRERVHTLSKLKAWFSTRFARSTYRRWSSAVTPDDAAVVLFTSGSEGAPKGVVLSHANLLANRAQLAARVDFSAHDIILNVLPFFHSFGLSAGTLLPLFSGMKIFLYPSPLHYRIVPEIAYDVNATILFGTNTFLKGYAEHAHPYDFYSIRYVFAGAEKLQQDTRQIWADKFGIRLFEGYGTTETSPVLATNTPMDFRAGSIGQLLPGIEHYLEPVPGVGEGGRLVVRGPNVMLGYLIAGGDGAIVATRTDRGLGWYDTGDIITIDDDGFLWIRGRAKRFAKIGGEMVSLAFVEDLASGCWPEPRHAVVSVTHERKGEQLVLMTEQKGASRQVLLDYARRRGVTEIYVPQKIIEAQTIPLLGNGKTDYGLAQRIVQQSMQRMNGEEDG